MCLVLKSLFAPPSGRTGRQETPTVAQGNRKLARPSARIVQDDSPTGHILIHIL